MLLFSQMPIFINMQMECRWNVLVHILRLLCTLLNYRTKIHRKPHLVMIIIYTCCGFDVTYIYSCGNVLCVCVCVGGVLTE